MTTTLKPISITADEARTNEERSQKGWNLYTKRACSVCGQISPFRTEDELAAMGWQSYEDLGPIRCPAHSKPNAS